MELESQNAVALNTKEVDWAAALNALVEQKVDSLAKNSWDKHDAKKKSWKGRGKDKSKAKGKGKGKGKGPKCFKCQERGHIAANCTKKD